MAAGLIVRPAEERDVSAMLDITSREIREGIAHFGVRVPTLDEALAEFQARGRFPWFVADLGAERAIGFAKAGPWKSREAYRWTTEIGVYVRPDRHGRGVGRALYAALFPALDEAGFRTIIAGIALPNPASVRLHESFGMASAGVIPLAGFKHGRWIDVGYWVRHLGQGDPIPINPTSDETTDPD
ncbi:MAG: GNAT family N-acetyltransferase [Phycisphaerales bacterium]|nr:GNAT family N-acetyltransferase [Phycisphaerales bacterium]